MVKENRLFLGNPGTGKSTLINCLLGERRFDAGVHYAVGLSKEYKRFVKGNIAYMDTPGLADEAIAKQAAQAITTALKEGGVYKLFFLVRLQNGRVVTEDIATLERVLDSLDADDLDGLDYKFTVILNQLGAAQYDTMMNRGDDFKKIKTLVNRKYLTESFCFVPRIPTLEEANQTVADLPRAFRDHLQSAPVISIHESQVGEINITGLAQRIEELFKELEKLRSENALLLKEMCRQECQYKDYNEVIYIEPPPRPKPLPYPAPPPSPGSPYRAIIVQDDSKGCCSRRAKWSWFFSLLVWIAMALGYYYWYRPRYENS